MKTIFDSPASAALVQRQSAARLGNILSNEIRADLNATRRVRLVRNNTGFDLERKVRYGLGIGGADMVGLLPGGRAFAIESKLGTSRLTAVQTAWWRAWRMWGGRGGVARSVDEAFELLKQAEET